MFAGLSGRLAVSVVLVLTCVACASPVAGQPKAATANPTGTPAETLTADKVPAEIKAAYQQASAVHVKGSLTEESTAIALDLQLNKDSASGTISQDAATIPVRWVKDVYYFQFNDSVIKMIGQSPTSVVGKQLRDKWIPSTSALAKGMADAFKDLLSYDTFLSSTIGKLVGASLTAGGKTTINGTAALEFKEGDGSLAVAATAPHYLLRLVTPAPTKGTLDFAGWNQPVQVTAPAPGEIFTGS
jgi:hypothetical protein